MTNRPAILTIHHRAFRSSKVLLATKYFHTKILCDDTDISKFRCDEVITDSQIIPKDINVNESPENIISIEDIDEPKLREDV